MAFSIALSKCLNHNSWQTWVNYLAGHVLSSILIGHLWLELSFYRITYLIQRTCWHLQRSSLNHYHLLIWVGSSRLTKFKKKTPLNCMTHIYSYNRLFFSKWAFCKSPKRLIIQSWYNNHFWKIETVFFINGWQLAKMKKSIPDMSLS